MVNDRGAGTPKTDAERAASHYGITEAEYKANPEAYPLPERGTGLVGSTAGGIGWGILAIIGLIIWGIGRKKK
jgi:hypothetical protein